MTRTTGENGLALSGRPGPVAGLAALLFVLNAGAARGQTLAAFPQVVDDEFAAYVSEMGPEAVSVEVDLDLIRSGPARLDLPLPDGRVLVAERSLFEDRGDGNALWTGRVPGADHDGVQLTLENGYLIAWLGGPGGSRYHLNARPDGSGRLSPAVRAGGAFCGGGVVPREDDAPGMPQAPARSRSSSDRPGRVESASNHDRLDILVMYTSGAAAVWRSVGGAGPAVQAAIDRLNTVLRNSEIPVTANLVLRRSAPPELDTPVSTLYKLSWNQRAAAARHQYGADLVHLFSSAPYSDTGVCGRGYLLLKDQTAEDFAPFGYAWTSNGPGCGYQWSVDVVFAHEVGHNLGGNHDPDNASISKSQAVRPFAYGHTDEGATPAIATLMSYGVDVPTEWVPYFSSVRRRPSGWTIGIAGERENERALQETVHEIVRLSDYAPADLGPPPPWPPVDVAGKATTSSTVHLTWTDDADDEAGFVVWHRLVEGEWAPVEGEWVLFSELPPDSEEERVTDLLPGNIYEFAVGAYNNNETNRVSYGNRVTVELPELPKSPRPAAPTGLTGVATSPTSVRLAWSDESDNEDGFEVHSRLAGGRWRTAARLPADTTSADLTSLKAGGRHDFRVRAYNSHGGSNSGIVTVSLPAVQYTDCVPSSAQIVFDHGYTVSMCIEYEKDGETVRADAVDYALDSGQSGLLYFFDRDNAEVLIKVLDGCRLNDHRWVFVAPVTTLAFNLYVDETATGKRWQHRNPRGGATAATKSDTAAFPCSAAAAASTTAPAARGGTEFDRRADGGGNGSAGSGSAGSDGVDLVDAGSSAARLEPASQGTAGVGRPIRAGEPADCEPQPVLTLGGGYTVRMCVEYIREGETVVEEVKDYGLSSQQSAILYFFDRDNAEVLVKVLDGCRLNGHRWVFVAPVTTLAFNLSIEPPGGGETWTHENRLDRTAAAKSDNQAFACNP